MEVRGCVGAWVRSGRRRCGAGRRGEKRATPAASRGACLGSAPLAFFIALLLAAAPAQAQDTTRVPADTARADTLRRDTTRPDTTAPAPRRTLAEREALPLGLPRPGRTANGLPPRTSALDATELVAREPGVFRYNLGGVGWPHGLSVRGRPPAQTTLTLDGRPFDDPLTGRPRYDLLPLPFLDTLRTQASGGAMGTPGAVRAALRPYDYARPLTTLRYRSGGFQSIGALHTQQRKVRFFGVPAFAQFTGGFFGRGADNADFLRGSSLNTERRLLGRVRYRQRGWAAQVMALHNRRRIGANSGVRLAADQPPSLAFAPAPPVRFPDARRRLLRTDLSATLRLRDATDGFGRPAAPPDSLAAETAPATLPLTATVYRTSQTLRYRNPGLASSLGVDTTRAPPFTPTTFTSDSLEAQTVRYGVRLAARLDLRAGSWGRHALALRAHAWRDVRAGEMALPEGAARTRLHLSARDSTRLAGLDAVLNAGFHSGSRQTYPSAGVRLARSVARDTLRERRLRLFAEARLAGQPVSWIADEGFGVLVRPLPDGQAPGRVLAAEIGAQGRAGSFGGRLSAFAERTADRLDLFAADTSAAVVRAVLSRGTVGRAGATLAGRWRARAERGFYATATGTVFLQRGGPSRPRRVAGAVPRVHGRARLGARYAFFTGDLDMDAYIQGRFWSQMAGRAPHGPTGRLVRPPPGRLALGPAGTLDLHAEAQIRAATLFFSYENALSGTQVQRGVLGAPVYPLPAQRFRFGVYWPIFD